MTNQSPKREFHFGLLEKKKQAVEVAAAEKRKVDQAGDSLERAQALRRESHAAVAAHNAVEAASVGADTLPVLSPEQLAARRADEDKAAASDRMCVVLDANLAKVRAEHQPFVAEVARLSREVEESAIGVLVEEGELALQRLQVAMNTVAVADSAVKAIIGTLAELKNYREVERLNIAAKKLKYPTVKPDIAGCLDFLHRLQTDADAQMVVS